MSYAPLSRQRLAARENLSASRIPYKALLDAHTVKTWGGEYLQVLRLGGVPHESADAEDIFAWHAQLNTTLRNIADPSLALWTHVVRRRAGTYPLGTFPAGFAADLNARYQRKLGLSTMRVNELYLTLVYRPVTPAQGVFARLRPPPPEEVSALNRAAIATLDEITQSLLASLARYEPRRLALIERTPAHPRHGADDAGETSAPRTPRYSEALEFLGFLANGEWQPVPLPRAPVNEALATSRALFGYETFELRQPATSLFGAALAIKEYPAQSEPGLLNPLLSLPFDFTLTQSFSFIARPMALAQMTRQRNRMENAGDVAQSQIEEIDEALDDLASGRVAMGVHHLSLVLLADTQALLAERIAQARNALADCGMVIAREDLALEAAFWAQLPGNFGYRPRHAPITSRNFAGFASLHNYPLGRAHGNDWGEAVALLRTSAGSPFYFNFHNDRRSAELPEASSPNPAGDARSGSRAPSAATLSAAREGHSLANTFICGPSEAGKTVLQGFLGAMLQKFGVTSVYFDKDRGLEILVRALGGRYLALKTGRASGFNPFQLPPTPANVAFLNSLMRALVAGPGGSGSGSESEREAPLSPSEAAELDLAIRTVLGLPQALRRIGQLRASLNPTDPNGVAARLARWCSGGTEGWLFDNETDTLDFEGASTFGFDMTEFLDHPVTRAPTMMYLFHRVKARLDGRRTVIAIDEGWKALSDAYFQAVIKDELKTIRKLNGFVIFATQSPSDAIQSGIGKTLIEQTATQIFLPNPRADAEDYVKGFALTERELEIIKEELTPGSRRFLVKQGHHSAVCELDLKGLDNELAVLSGTAANVGLVTSLIETHGESPEAWLPEFFARRKSA